jgi:hypothetical protein
MGTVLVELSPKQPDATSASKATTSSESRLIGFLDAERLVKVSNGGGERSSIIPDGSQRGGSVRAVQSVSGFVF